MKIACTQLNERYFGLARTAQTLYQYLSWNTKKFPVFDMISHFDPDVIFIDLKFVTQTIIQALQEFQHIKVVLFGQGVPQNLRISTVVASPTSSPVVRRNIESEEYATLYLYDSANIVDIFNAGSADYLNAELSYFYNRQDKDSYIDQLTLLSGANNKYQVKIVGPVRFNLPCYLGTITYEGLSSLYRGSQFVLDYNTDQFLDIIANGGCPITKTPVKQNICPYYTSHQHLYDIVSGGRTSELNANIHKYQRQILMNDTCYNRLAEIFLSIDEQDYADEIMTKLKERTSCVLE